MKHENVALEAGDTLVLSYTTWKDVRYAEWAHNTPLFTRVPDVYKHCDYCQSNVNTN